MEEVRVTSSRMFIWPGIHAEVGENVRVLAPGTKQAFILTDRKCIPIAKRVALSLYLSSYECAGYAMYPGESRKNLRTALGIFEKMARTKMDRGCVFVTVGGGVVCDMGSFAASTYRDGLRLFHVPTSLVAQVDAALSGKTGVNVKDGRNVLTHAYSATAVFVDPTVLDTLPRREFLAGLAEVVKYGMVREADILAYLEENVEGLNARKPAVMEEIVFRCASIKAAVEQEAASSGVRAILDYGRTVGRALQVAGRYQKIHPGEALAVGMEAEARMAERVGVAPPGVARTQNRILRLLDLPTRVRGISAEKLIEGIEYLHKSESGGPRFPLPEAVGRASHGVDVPPEVVAEGVRSVLMPGGRLRAVRPMAAPEESALEEVPRPSDAS